jgi:hypothetical protein
MFDTLQQNFKLGNCLMKFTFGCCETKNMFFEFFSKRKFSTDILLLFYSRALCPRYVRLTFLAFSFFAGPLSLSLTQFTLSKRENFPAFIRRCWRCLYVKYCVEGCFRGTAREERKKLFHLRHRIKLWVCAFWNLILSLYFGFFYSRRFFILIDDMKRGKF